MKKEIVILLYYTYALHQLSLRNLDKTEEAYRIKEKMSAPWRVLNIKEMVKIQEFSANLWRMEWMKSN